MCAFPHVTHGSSLTLFAEPTSRDWYQAIRHNQLAELKSMASSPAALAVRDARGSTPLMYAAAIGSPEALKILLDAGADVNAKNGLDVTARFMARSIRRKIRLLIEAGADVNARSKVGRTPLIVAAAHPGSAERGYIAACERRGAEGGRRRELYGAERSRPGE